jgi:hypothetical protein
LVILIFGCKDEPNQGYAVFYNYSEHGNSSVGYVEVVFPVPFKATHSKHNDYDYFEKSYVKGAEMIAHGDTIDLKYAPLNLRHHYFFLTKNKNADSDYTSYILQLDEPYKWGSLFQADSLFSQLLNEVEEVRFLDTSGKYRSLRDIEFKSIYFLDGKEVQKGSNEFYKKMKIERPPLLKVD